MSFYNNYPRLKRGVDLQLQTAFSSGEWARVVQLATKRAAMTDKQYHQIVKVSAESHLDGSVARYAPIIYCEQILKSDTVITDVESYDLLEWATAGVANADFAQKVLGPLRLRSVKSGKFKRPDMIKCFEACLRAWDLDSAQQIAAYMDRTFKQERMLQLWNVAATFLLASNEQCPKEKRFLYNTLATRMALKVIQDKAGAPSTPTLQEEEVLVYYGIISKTGSLKDWQALLADENVGPLAQCKLGRKDPVINALLALEKYEAWSDIYALTKASMSAPDSTPESFKPSILASDWVLWKYFLGSAGKVREDYDIARDEAFGLIESAFPGDSVAIHRRTKLLAKILACLEMPTEKSTTLVVDLMVDMIQNMTVVARFEDLRPLVQRLSVEQQDSLLVEIAKSNPEATPLAAVMKTTLLAKLRFLIFTARAESLDQFETIVTEACRDLRALAHPNRDDSPNAITELLKNLEISESKPIKEELSPDFSILIAVSLIKLSKLTRGNAYQADHKYLLQAIAVLENQLHITPKEHCVLILLTRLHVIIGSAWRARETWDTLEVKRTIVDSLAPLFLDRLTSISPSLVSDGRITKTVLSYYETVFRTAMPKSLVEAFESKSYASIIQIPTYIEGLRGSSTRASGYVEKQRALRAFEAAPANWTVPDHPVYGDTINYGPFPAIESTSAIPVYETLSLGPGPSNERTQLSVLNEKFFDLLTAKPPMMYKPSPAGLAVDEVYVTEQLARLANSFSHHITAESLSKLTPAEAEHFQTVALLSIFIARSCPPRSDVETSVKPLVDTIVASLTRRVKSLESRITSAPDSTGKALRFFSSLHDLWHIRETASAIRLSLNYITLFNGRQKPPKAPTAAFSANLKALATVVAMATANGKSWIASAKKAVAENGMERKITEVAFDGSELAESVRGAADVEGTSAATWSRHIVDSWKRNIKGWENVRWD